MVGICALAGIENDRDYTAFHKSRETVRQEEDLEVEIKGSGEDPRKSVEESVTCLRGDEPRGRDTARNNES